MGTSVAFMFFTFAILWTEVSSQYVYQRTRTIQCPRIRSPENGRRVDTRTSVGSTVHFSCFSGYTLYGSPKRTCREDGTWNGTDTTCDDERSDCPVLPTPVNGRKTGNRYNRYDVIIFHCNPGYEMLGSRRRKCLRSGEWSGEDTRCLGPDDFDSVPDVAANFGMRLDALAHASCSSQVDRNNRDQCRGSRARFLDTNNPNGLDLYFVFDASESVGDHQFNASVDFAKALIGKVGVSTLPGGTQVGAIAFASKTKVLFSTQEVLSVQDALDRLNNVNWSNLSEEINSGTNTREALKFLRENMIVASKQAFPERRAKQAVILITDGVHNMGGDPSVEAEKLREDEDVEVFCIGVGKNIVKSQLQKIASDPPKEHFFVLKDYMTLEWLISNMTSNSIDYSLCGVSGRTAPVPHRMIGGAAARPGAWPWQAAIFDGDGSRSLRKVRNLHELPHIAICGDKMSLFQKTFHCGGVLVASEWVMSAAHCFPPDKNIKQFRIYLGMLTRSDKHLGNEVQDFGIRELQVHSSYDHERLDYDYDIALVRLSRPVTFGPYVRTVCLPGDIKVEESSWKNDNDGYVTGWGVTSSTSWRPAKVLQQVKLPIRSDAECLREIRSRKSEQALSYTDRMFCAGRRGHDACKGDSGGPFVVRHVKKENRSQRWVLTGVVSWGVSPVCDDRGYGFYINVTSLMAWARLFLQQSRKQLLQSRSSRQQLSTPPKDVTSDITNCGVERKRRSFPTHEVVGGFPVDWDEEDQGGEVSEEEIPDVRFGIGDTAVDSEEEDSEGGAWPWQTALFVKTDQGTNEYLCGASLLDSKWVLTAAHCIMRVYSHGNVDTDIVAGLGLTKMSLPGTSQPAHAQYVPVKKAYIHPNYNSAVFDYDIALLELRDAAVFSSLVRPVHLPANVRQGLWMSQVGTTGTLLGWGRLGENSPTAQILHQVTIPIQSHDTCERAMANAGFAASDYTPRMFCAGAGGRDACPGDSGGPFMVSRRNDGRNRWYLVGVVSAGTDKGCGRPGQLGLYTMVAKYLDWIHCVIDTVTHRQR
ncbi:complement factor B-like [Branchiostoma floridae x Branchiostoma japonicum]